MNIMLDRGVLPNLRGEISPADPIMKSPPFFTFPESIEDVGIFPDDGDDEDDEDDEEEIIIDCQNCDYFSGIMCKLPTCKHKCPPAG